jgi:hypothetical protein
MASTSASRGTLGDSDSADSLSKGIIHESIVQKDGSQTAFEVSKIREHTDAVSDEKVAFLDTFSPEEEKRIMRKVDWRILPIIGLMMLVKQVSIGLSVNSIPRTDPCFDRSMLRTLQV